MSLTESSWMLRPLNKASLGYCVPDRCVRTLDRASSAAIAASVGLRCLMDQWGVWLASPTPLTRFIGLAPLCRLHAWPTHRTPPLRSAKARGSWKSGVASLNQIKEMGWFGQGQISQGTLCPRDATSKNFRSGTHRDAQVHIFRIVSIYPLGRIRSSEAAMGGEARSAPLVRQIAQKTGARSARARTRGQNPLV